MKIKSLILSAMLAVAVFACGCSEASTDETTKKEEVKNQNTVNETIDQEQDVDSDDDEAQVEWDNEVKDESESAGNEESPLDVKVDEKPEVEPPAVEPVPDPKFVSVEEIKLSMYEVSLNVSEKKMPIVTMYPLDSSDKSEIWVSSDTSVATVDSIGNIQGISEGKCTVTVTSAQNPAVFATVNVTVKSAPAPAPEVEQEAEVTYIDGILVVNKTYPLPASYAPGWETEATPFLWKMIEGAKKDGINLWVKSGYRSYYDQKYIYNNYVARDGQAEADTYSARPGHSEHQTGLAYDMNSTSNDFAGTPEAKWIEENCYKYGFILRYPKGKEHITGYIYEPWHVRYVGIEKAAEIFESGLCLEEFLNITSVYA